MDITLPKHAYIDAHCHLAAPEFNDDLELVIKRARETGVNFCVVVSECVTEFQQVLEICRSNPGFLYPCLGVHPVQSQGSKDQVTSVTLEEIEVALPLLHKYSKDLVGIGEIGLDFTPHICHTEEEREIQREAFRRQIQVALEYDFPVNVHSRSAAMEAIGVLRECGAKKVILHNFAGKPSVAMEAVSLGYHLSFPPRVSVREDRDKVLRQVPLEKICLETDSPALGISIEKRNEPSQIPVVCEHIAKVKRLDSSVVAKAAFENTLELFDKIPMTSC